MEINLTKCRGCLAEDPEMHNLFQRLTEELTLADILLETTSIQIGSSKEISPFFCMKCTGIVVDFYNFKIQFMNSQTYFQDEPKNTKDNSFTNFMLQDQDIVPEKIIVIEDSQLFENIKNNAEDLQSQAENKKADKCQDPTKDNKQSFPESSSLNTTVNNKEIQGSVVMPDGATEKNQRIVPEVGEFTVQNELVQLIESVVFCCKSCNKEYLLKDDFFNHMISEHDKAKVDPSKFTKKTLVKVPLAEVIEENSDTDFELDHDSTKDKQKLCKICNTLISNSEYDYHHEQHKSHICHCGAKFVKKSHLVNHENSVHVDERSFMCKYCDKTFKSKQCLTKHVKYHTHPRSEICHICGQIFNCKGVLNTHIKLKHFPTRDFQCTQCGLKFPLKSTLDKHCRRHHTSNRKKMFSCSQCNMTYFDKSTLNRHVSVKHSEEPVKAKCQYCGKTFTSKGNLYKHLRTSHKFDKVLVGRDGSITVQVGHDLIKAPLPVNKEANLVLEQGMP